MYICTYDNQIGVKVYNIYKFTCQMLYEYIKISFVFGLLQVWWMYWDLGLKKWLVSR